jgi:DNA-binding transcriptional ArsR family regulator
MRMTVVDDARLDSTFAALASTTRRRILLRLTEGEATVNELAEPFNLALPAISKHVKVLQRAGLVVRRRHAQFRPCALNPDALDVVSEWAVQCREAWEGRLDRLADYTARVHGTDDEGIDHA